MTDVAAQVREWREAIWLSRPADIDRMWHREGARGHHFANFVQGEGWTRIFADELHNLRDLAKAGDLELSALVVVCERLLESPNGRLQSYHMVDAPKAVGYVASALPDVKSHAELATLLEELEMYIARLNYWIDTEIPYEECSRAFDAYARKHAKV